MSPCIYFDHSATSFPKPPEVIEAMQRALVEFSGSPGRAGHPFAIRASRTVFEAREQVAALLGVPSSERVIFTLNATHALNTAIKGVLHAGDHVIISGMEHNSILRPLRHMEQEGLISLTVAACNRQGEVDLDGLEASFTPSTRLVVTLHGSNVCGSIFPIKKIAEICKRHKALYLVDAAQTAGFLPISLAADGVDMLAFSGHKCLMGPTGTGGLCIADPIEVASLVQGGSGSHSERGFHPDFFPDRLEAGTPNIPGIAGLLAGVRYVAQQGLEALQRKQGALCRTFLDGLAVIPEIRVYGPEAGRERLPVVSVNCEGMSSSELAYRLDHDYGIMTRPGLQCSPLAHHTLGTAPQGTVRFSFGHFNTQEEVEYALSCLRQIARSSTK